jgi:hypothetical protein
MKYNKTHIWKQLSLFLLLSFPFLALAQQYDKSAGIRLGGTSGLTFKKFIVDEQAIETIVSSRRDGVQVTVTWIMHHPMEVSFNENFFFYYGVGGHIGVEKHDDISKQLYSENPPLFNYENKSFLSLGADALIGVEYRMLNVPITFNLDMKPYVNYVGMRKLEAKFWDVAIAIKYIF